MTARFGEAGPQPDADEQEMPDLTGLGLEELVRPGNAVLERAIRLARARRAGAGIVYAGWNSALYPAGEADGLDLDVDAH